jgi:hypothetical protein
MPKMKDLGINVIPETMMPPECLPLTIGPVCHAGGVTINPCYAASQPPCYGGTQGCYASSPPCYGGTNQPCYGGTNQPCYGGTNQPCYGGTNQPCYGGTNQPCYGVSLQCIAHTTITICYTGSVCPAHSIVCHGGTYCPGGSLCTFGTQPGTITITPTTPQILQGGLTHESIGVLKQQLHETIKALDEQAKTLGPQTSEEIDAREKQLKTELDGLAARRSELKKK